MCGIVAFFSSAEPISPEALDAATEALQHRGPDAQRTWIAADGRAGLGHRLLSIASPHGMQPILSEDGRRALVTNGEFYDHVRIRRDLETRGHHFRTDTDSEIALHLYEDFGPSCLEHLRGEFAFVLWDGETRTVFAARDRFGIKPLFYARHGDALLFASEAKALFAAGFPAAWDEAAVYQQLFGCFHADRSLFAGVRQVPPGHYLTGAPEAPRLIRYWDVGYPRKSDSERCGEDECVDEVRRLLTEAVTLRMQAHVPIGYLLSGGLDSTAVLSIAAAQSARPLQAFTIGFDDAAFDESAKAQIAADHVGAELHLLRLTAADLADHFSETVRHGESIQVNAHGTARFLLSRAIQTAGYRAVMAGEGADELFAGYGFVRPAVLSGKGHGGVLGLGSRLLRLAAPLTPTEREIAAVSPRLARLHRAVGLPETLLERFAGGIGMLRSLLAPDFAARFATTDPYWRFLRGFDWRGQVWGREPAKQILYLWLRSVFVNYHMAADRLDMAHAVEVRLPFLDHKLFDYAGRIPVSMLAAEGRQKHLLREAAKPYLPDAIYRGLKQPFYAPPSALRPGSPLHDLVQDTVRSAALTDLPFFDREAVIGLVARAGAEERTARAIAEPLLMMIVSFCFLQEHYAPSSEHPRAGVAAPVAV